MKRAPNPPQPAVPPRSVDGVLPPHDLEAEAATISACLLDADAYTEVASWVTAEMFFSEKHRRTWEGIVAVSAAGRPLDVVAVASWLKSKGRLEQSGGMGYLTEILNAAPAIANVVHYARTVRDLDQVRRAILTCQTYAARGYHEAGDARSFLEALGGEVSALAEAAGPTDRTVDMLPAVKGAYDSIVSLYRDGRPPGIATGLRTYDALTCGLHRQDVTLVAARPGMGKTAAMLSIALGVAGTSPLLISDDGTPWQDQAVLFCSLEMPGNQLAKRMMAMWSRVDAHRIRTGRLLAEDWQALSDACQRLAGLPIYLNDETAITPTKLRNIIRGAKRKAAKRGARIAAVMVDYIQLMRADERCSSRAEEVGSISRAVKVVAKEEDVALIAGCQLNRALEGRSGPDKRPRISDLRESGDLEQDADNIVFLYRGSVYGEEDPEDEPGRAEMILAKQRNGPTGTAVVRYDKTCTNFLNFDHL